MPTKKARASVPGKSSATRVPAERKTRGRQTRGDNTRVAIIEAARRKFVSAPYDQVGLRDIAAEAGIDKRLITRYFGSKEGLFAEVVAVARRDLGRGTGKPSDPRQVGSFMTAQIFAPGQMSSRDRLELVSLCMQSAASRTARDIIHDSIESSVLPAWMGISGKESDIRAALLFSTLIGIAMVREILEIRALRKAEHRKVEKYLAPFVQHLVDG